MQYNTQPGKPAQSTRATAHNKFDENEINRKQMENDVFEYMMEKNDYRK